MINTKLIFIVKFEYVLLRTFMDAYGILETHLLVCRTILSDKNSLCLRFESLLQMVVLMPSLHGVHNVTAWWTGRACPVG
jgi:hypothetical protein